ncbi:MAG: ParA family protein [Gammaproteobacteria bacterium]|nr:ParA family protein [Gammaproteobacteria bacterium]
MTTWAVFSIKGGVGKTSSAINLAYLASRSGARTLLWDLDPQGAATYILRESLRGAKHGERIIAGTRSLSSYLVRTDFPGLDLIQADLALRYADLLIAKGDKPRRRLAQILAPLRRRYDRIYLDCPPGLTLMAESIFRASDGMLIPTIPAPLALRAVDQLVDYVTENQKVTSMIAPFFSMVDRRKLAHRRTVVEGRQKTGFLRSYIPYSSAIEQIGERRAPVLSFARKHPASLAYVSMWQEAERAMHAHRAAMDPPKNRGR